MRKHDRSILTRHAVEAVLTSRRATQRGRRDRRHRSMSFDLVVAAALMLLAIVIFAVRALGAP